MTKSKESPRKGFTFSLPIALVSEFLERCKQENRSPHDVVVELIRGYLDSSLPYRKLRVEQQINMLKMELKGIDLEEKARKVAAKEVVKAQIKRFYLGVTLENIPREKTLMVNFNALTEAHREIDGTEIWPLFYQQLPVISGEMRNYMRELLDEMSAKLHLPKE